MPLLSRWRATLALILLLPMTMIFPPNTALAAALVIDSATAQRDATGQTVTVTGHGARPNAQLALGGGSRTYLEGCSVPLRGGQGQIQLIAKMRADGQGNFAVTFPVAQYERLSTLFFFSAYYFEEPFNFSTTDQSERRCVDIAVKSATFPETGKTVRGLFLYQWEERGGLAIYGYPISEPFIEKLEDGNSYRVQYFERVRMEFHEERSIEPYILLGQFGRQLHPADPPVAPIPGATYFAQTGHNITRQAFTDYWNANGGLEQFGYPISEEIDETLSGQSYRVQYFERARFEWHPENPAESQVLLGQFGRQVCGDRCR